MYIFLTTDISSEVTLKFAQAGIVDPTKATILANEILNKLSPADKATISDATSANASVLKYFDAFIDAVKAENSGSSAPANPGTGATTASKAGIAPTAADDEIANQFAQAAFVEGMKRATNSEVKDVLTSKPRPVDRFKGVKEMKISMKDETLKTLEEYGAVLVPDSEEPGNSANYQAIMELAKKAKAGGATTEIYINEKGRPTIAGYEIADPAAPGQKVIVPKNEDVFTAVLAANYAGRIPTKESGSKLGAILIKKTSKKGTQAGTQEKNVARIRGLNNYYAIPSHENGKPVYTVNNKETTEVGCRSALSFKVFVKDAAGNVTDKKKTVRLAGRAVVPAIDIVAEYEGPLNLSKSTGQTVGIHQRVDDVRNVRAAIAQLRALARDNDNAIGVTQEFNDLAKKLEAYSGNGSAASID